MKLTRLEVGAARLQNEYGHQYLRLSLATKNLPSGEVWYEPTHSGFVMCDDETADKLEKAYQEILS